VDLQFFRGGGHLPSLTGVSPDTRRSLAVAPLIGDKRCYGEAPARLRGGYGPVSGNGPPEWRGLRNEWVGFPESQAGSRKATETRKTGEPRYAATAGTRARVTLGTSVQPSICWQVRIQMAVPVFGTPCRAT